MAKQVYVIYIFCVLLALAPDRLNNGQTEGCNWGQLAARLAEKGSITLRERNININACSDFFSLFLSISL